MQAHGGMPDAEHFAQGFFQVADIGISHAFSIVDKAHEGRRFAFRLREVEEFWADAPHHRRLMPRQGFFHGAVEQPGGNARAAFRINAFGKRDEPRHAFPADR